MKALIFPFALLVAMSAASAADSGDEIAIQKATYGMKNDVDATPGVKALCEGKTSCSFKVEPKQLDVSDPAPGVAKTFRLTWSCGKRGMPAVEKSDYDTVNLSCGKR